MDGLRVGIGVLAVAGGLAVAWVAYDRSARDKHTHSAKSGEEPASSASRASDPPAEKAKCDLVAQAGCGAGERCDIQCVDMKKTELGCFPDVGSGELGDKCNAKTPCKKRLYCAAQPTGCSAYCNTDADCPDGMTCGLGKLTYCGPPIAVRMCFETVPK